MVFILASFDVERYFRRLVHLAVDVSHVTFNFFYTGCVYFMSLGASKQKRASILLNSSPIRQKLIAYCTTFVSRGYFNHGSRI